MVERGGGGGRVAWSGVKELAATVEHIVHLPGVASLSLHVRKQGSVWLVMLLPSTSQTVPISSFPAFPPHAAVLFRCGPCAVRQPLGGAGRTPSRVGGPEATQPRPPPALRRPRLYLAVTHVRQLIGRRRQRPRALTQPRVVVFKGVKVVEARHVLHMRKAAEQCPPLGGIPPTRRERC